MDSGLEMAIKLLRNRQATNPSGALLVLTDGQDCQRHDYSNLMEQLSEGVVCHTFGYGSDHNAALLSQIVEQGHGGTFTYIDQVDGVGHAFATVVDELFICIGKQLRIQLEFNGDYTITHAHTTYSYEPNNHPYGTCSDQVDPQLSLIQVNYELDIQRNRIETSEVLKRAVVETDYERARQMINVQLAKISSSISAANPLCQQLMWDLEFQYPSQIESSISLATVHMQHEQKHNSHATTTTISEACKMSSNRGRSRSNYLF
ncbi:unnamed protein product [Rotaria socialis]|uniref:VWFA domain-containing protein n=1 Tax=Rotaria socialis TaxID=392032 RepID=A0A817TUB0_9BILA|nr:unnamed protein product [Rotaria socialis]